MTHRSFTVLRRSAFAFISCAATALAIGAGLQPADVQIKADAGVNVRVTPRAGNTSKNIDITVNKQDRVSVNGAQTYPAPPPPPPGPSMPFVDKTKIPPPVTLVSTIPDWDGTPIPALFSGPRVRSTWRDIDTGLDCNPTAANCGQAPGNVANGSDIGAFREPCNFAKFQQIDPIVSPGVEPSAHLHAFFGNVDLTASTTNPALAGNSTCAGGTLNRTAYWVPAMIDTRSGTPVVPRTGVFYYKTGYNGIAPSAIQPLPQGLRMVSGKASNATPTGPWRYGCVGDAEPNGSFWADPAQGIPRCKAGSDMLMEIIFPQCWNGKDLDSPDHISHMASPVNGACPATHPVPVPVVSFEIHYAVTAADDMSKWRLASDMYDTSLPGGFSGHGDWFGGWDVATFGAIVSNCENKSLDCHAYLLGDGRTLY